MNPIVSIIIPSYNRANLIGETLDSVLTQTYTNWECLIVDDGSTDNTDEVVRAYVNKDPRFKYYHRPPEYLPGGNGARNFGFKMSKGEYVNWFDSDDIMLKHKLKKKIELIIKTNTDFVICKGAIFNEFPDVIPIPWGLHTNGNVLFNHMAGKIAFVTNGPLFKKSYLINTEQLFNENLLVRQEWEYFNRLLLTSPKIDVISEPLYLFRKLESGIRRTHSYKKVISKIKAEELTFKNIRKSELLSQFEKLTYRKIMIRRCLTFFNSLKPFEKFKAFPYTIKVVFKVLSLKLIKFHLQNKFNVKTHG